jgi:tetratricopeptide (TPR) repeat protein
MVAAAAAMVETPAALASARTHAEEARAIAVAALGADHPQLGFVEFTLASLDTDEGHVDLALTRYDHAIAILTAAYGPSHLVVVKTQLKRAFALADDGRTDQARDALIAVEPTLIAVEGAGHQDVAMLRRARGSLEIDQHHPAAAIAPLTAAIATYTRRGDPGPDLGRAYELLGIAHRDLGHQAESLAAFAHAEAAYPDDAADEHARVRALIEEAGGR